jgi:type II secretory pathway component PulF
MFTITILMVVFAIPPLLWLINRVGHKQREPGMSWMDLVLARKRPTTARFLLHCSLLIEAGITKDVAIQKAAIKSGKRWLMQKLRSYEQQSKQRDSKGHLFFSLKKLRMADAALATPRSRGQVTAMQQVATWYRDSSSGIIEWWVQLLVPFFAVMILLAIFVTVVSLFMPLIAIVSGLTGGKGGGTF